MDKLTFLRQYRDNIELVADEKLTDIEKLAIPKSWQEVFKEKDKNRKKDKLISLWNSVCKKELSNTISYLSENLLDLDLIIDNGQYAALYSVMSENDEVLFYEGGLPTKSTMLPDEHQIKQIIPARLRKFYETLHNGFYYFPSRAMGLVPFDHITHFAEHEWGIIDELDEPLEINLDYTYGFFENGMGGYVAVDLRNSGDEFATLWFSDDVPEYRINFWDIVDEWIVIGMQDD